MRKLTTLCTGGGGQLTLSPVTLWIYQVYTLISDSWALFINKTIKEAVIFGMQHVSWPHEQKSCQPTVTSTMATWDFPGAHIAIGCHLHRLWRVGSAPSQSCCSKHGSHCYLPAWGWALNKQRGALLLLVREHCRCLGKPGLGQKKNSK